MIAIEKLKIFKFNKDKSPFIVFCIFFIIPTLMSLFAWMIFNARGIGDGSGNSFMLLFDSKHLFTDWLLAKAWSSVRNPWEYIGSVFEDKLPVCFYGPSIFMFLKMLPGKADLNPYEVMIHVSTVFLIIFVGWICLLKASSFITGGLDEISTILSIIILAFSFPIFFAVNRGNTAIISYLFLTLFLYFCICKFSSYIWIVFLNLYAFSSFQLLPIFAISILCFFTLKTFKPKFLVIISTTPILAYILYTGINLETLWTTYNISAQLVGGWGGVYNHDFVSGLKIINFNPFLSSIFILFSISIPIYLLLIFLRKNKNNKNSIEIYKLFKQIFQLEKSYNVVFLVFSWSALSLVISSPSADYHLLRIIPFIYLALHLALNQKNGKDKISDVILFLNVASGAVVISYMKIWDIFRFIDIVDMAVPLRSINLIIWVSTMFYVFLSWHRNKLDLKEV